MRFEFLYLGISLGEVVFRLRKGLRALVSLVRVIEDLRFLGLFRQIVSRDPLLGQNDLLDRAWLT